MDQEHGASQQPALCEVEWFRLCEDTGKLYSVWNTCMYPTFTVFRLKHLYLLSISDAKSSIFHSIYFLLVCLGYYIFVNFCILITWLTILPFIYGRIKKTTQLRIFVSKIVIPHPTGVNGECTGGVRSLVGTTFTEADIQTRWQHVYTSGWQHHRVLTRLQVLHHNETEEPSLSSWNLSQSEYTSSNYIL